jgi:hypothetical protein
VLDLLGQGLSIGISARLYISRKTVGIVGNVWRSSACAARQAAAYATRTKPAAGGEFRSRLLRGAHRCGERPACT